MHFLDRIPSPNFWNLGTCLEPGISLDVDLSLYTMGYPWYKFKSVKCFVLNLEVEISGIVHPFLYVCYGVFLVHVLTLGCTRPCTYDILELGCTFDDLVTDRNHLYFLIGKKLMVLSIVRIRSWWVFCSLWKLSWMVSPRVCQSKTKTKDRGLVLQLLRIYV